jgi:sirohydrochlorin ferrochelatase
MTSSTKSESAALLLIAHGSRRAAANDDLHCLAEQLRERGGWATVQTSFLELAEPTIAEGGAACAETGAQRVVMLPYFLSPGIHVSKDLQNARDELAHRFPVTEFVLAQPLGRHPLLIDIVLQRAESANGV